MEITTEKVLELLNQAKDETLIPIPENISVLDRYMDKSTNHGVMQMFYHAYNKIMDIHLGIELGGTEK